MHVYVQTSDANSTMYPLILVYVLRLRTYSHNYVDSLYNYGK